VDKHFRTHGPADERRIYRQRSAVERVNSRLKEQLVITTRKNGEKCGLSWSS
jgi:hypothetical protein